MALFEAAGKVIGRYGYTGCSIARVTAKAKIAHGTFYLYFSSQQELFKEVRAALGQKMLIEVFKNVGPVSSVRDLEEKYIRASLDYFKKYPYMFKVMSTSEHAGARRDMEHMRNQVDFYAERLRDVIGPSFSEDYLQVLTVMIMGVRSNILQTYGLKDNVMYPPPEEAIQFYLNFIDAGAASLANLAHPEWSLGGAPSRLDLLTLPAAPESMPTKASPAAKSARRREAAVVPAGE
jgi:AcrR family transcriptional regulator